MKSYVLEKTTRRAAAIAAVVVAGVFSSVAFASFVPAATTTSTIESTPASADAAPTDQGTSTSPNFFPTTTSVPLDSSPDPSLSYYIVKFVPFAPAPRRERNRPPSVQPTSPRSRRCASTRSASPTDGAQAALDALPRTRSSRASKRQDARGDRDARRPRVRPAVVAAAHRLGPALRHRHADRLGDGRDPRHRRRRVAEDSPASSSPARRSSTASTARATRTATAPRWPASSPRRRTTATGIAGVGYAGVKVMPVTVLGADGTGQDSDVIAGVVWAAEHGADVILMSFSNPGYSPSLQDAIDYAWVKGRRRRRGDRQRRLVRRRRTPPATAASIGVSNTDLDDASTPRATTATTRSSPRRARASSRRRRRRLRERHGHLGCRGDRRRRRGADARRVRRRVERRHRLAPRAERRRGGHGDADRQRPAEPRARDRGHVERLGRACGRGAGRRRRAFVGPYSIAASREPRGVGQHLRRLARHRPRQQLELQGRAVDPGPLLEHAPCGLHAHANPEVRLHQSGPKALHRWLDKRRPVDPPDNGADLHWPSRCTGTPSATAAIPVDTTVPAGAQNSAVSRSGLGTSRASASSGRRTRSPAESSRSRSTSRSRRAPATRTSRSPTASTFEGERVGHRQRRGKRVGRFAEGLHEPRRRKQRQERLDQPELDDGQGADPGLRLQRCERQRHARRRRARPAAA